MTPSLTTKQQVPADAPIYAPVKEVDVNAITLSADEVLATVRCLTADIVEQFNGGHPGTPMGAASIGLALWGYAMKFNPKNAGWVNRDRFVLSNGHACLLQYIYLHLCGYPTWTLAMLKRYHSRDYIHSQAAGHPEIEFEGIEVTTGPLGQGIANAVGLAMASKHLASRFNQDGSTIIDNKIWVMSGDGCLQEGIGQEAISFAGHLHLDNLILIYDDNRVTVDGNINICFTEDTNAKMLAMGWEVIDVQGDATNDVAAIVDALRRARHSTSGKPVFINIVTQIGFGSKNEGLCPTHGAALGAEDVAKVKNFHGRNPEEQFVVPDHVYSAFDHVKRKGAALESDWNRIFEKYKASHPQLAAEFEQQIMGHSLVSDPAKLLLAKKDLPITPIPTRKASGLAIEALAPKMPQILAGSADLSGSTFVTWPNCEDFQAPSTGYGTYKGRQIRYGIREHAMAGIANGMAAYSPNAIIPVISTFFMFFLYAAPAVRMAALQRLRIICIATHDSIGIGEDGPTHQPIALASLFRAMPNVNFIRPADAEEVQGAWLISLDQDISQPTVISLSRQAVPLLKGTSRDQMRRGAYPIWSSTQEASSESSSMITLVATGSEVSLAIKVAQQLVSQDNTKGMTEGIRVVSMPIQSRFDAQSEEYRKSVLPSHTSLVIAIEAWSSYGWARYAHASMSMHSFGLSGPQADLYDHFGFSVDNLTRKIQQYADSRRDVNGTLQLPKVGEFAELLLP